MINRRYNRCIVIGAAPCSEEEICFIKSQVKQNDFIICADGGFDKCRALNIRPNAVYGDLDSIKDKSLISDKTKVVKFPVEKDFTDTFYCVKEGIKAGFKEIELLGCIGGRLDHTQANLQILYYACIQRIKAVLKDRKQDIFMLKGQGSIILGKAGQIVSVFPFGCEYCNVSYKGMKYPLKKGSIYSGSTLGVSNELICEQAEITVHEGTAIIIVSKFQ